MSPGASSRALPAAIFRDLTRASGRRPAFRPRSVFRGARARQRYSWRSWTLERSAEYSCSSSSTMSVRRTFLHRRRLQVLRRFAEPQHHTGQCDYDTQKRKPVAMPGIERGAFLQGICALQSSALLTRCFRNHTSVRINYRGDTAVGIAQQPAVVLDRAHPCHVEMLPGSASRTEPSVVGNIHEDLGAVEREVAHLVGEHRFIADEN